ncbi:MAG: penicillin-binding protein 1C, partial [Beijerinckiaceae bacterium]|nr:penicillin-binding protein 1C [Beijerinckiaceae bacterium]
DLSTLREASTIAVDRDGHLLRAFTTHGGRWRLPITPNAVDPRFIAMLKMYEDQRFETHGGVDYSGLVRAALQFAASGSIVSGGSTLTMQVARLLEPRSQRTIGAKLQQIIRAWQLEERFSKSEILRFYLALAPYGGNLEGLRAASIAYFGKEPARLSIGEQALLTALPQSPETRRPDRFVKAARAARSRVLSRAVTYGLLSRAEAERARLEPIPDARRAFPMLAAHATGQANRNDPKLKVLQFTYQKDLQAALEQLISEHARRIGAHVTSAALVINNKNGHVLARVGTADYFSRTRAGANDMTLALRSPGSALKPFIYALAFENGVAHPETMLEDRRTRYGSYAPENFDFTFQGQVTARTALQHSLNIPAVAVLQEVGAPQFLARLKNAGAFIKIPDASPAGLALALGGLGVTLTDLAQLYTGLARGGSIPQLIERLDLATPAAVERRITSPVAAWYVADILRGAPPPASARSGQIAFKTGTSYGFRDAIAVGFDRNHTIAVWFGRADNGAVPGMLAREFAAPALFEAFSRLGSERVPVARPPNAIVARTSQLPPPLRNLRKDTPKTVAATRSGALQIAYPPNGARVDLGLTRKNGLISQLAMKVQGGHAPFRWIINGSPLSAVSDLRRQAQWTPDGPGFARLSVIDSHGHTDSVIVRLE